MYISLANSFDHCTQGGTGDGSDTPPSLGRHSIVDNVDVSSVSMVSAKLLLDVQGKGVSVLEVAHEVRELSSFHAVAAPIKVVMGGREGI